MNAAGRWAFAFRQRAFLFMVHQGRKRLIVAAAYNATSCIATLAVEADPEQVEEVVFPVSELTSHKFWR